MDATNNNAKGNAMNRKITYQACLFNVGNNAGKIVVTKPANRPVRFAVGDLTKESGVKVRSWDNSTGKGIAIDVCVPEAEAKLGFDHWGSAAAKLAESFHGIEVVFQD